MMVLERKIYDSLGTGRFLFKFFEENDILIETMSRYKMKQKRNTIWS